MNTGSWNTCRCSEAGRNTASVAPATKCCTKHKMKTAPLPQACGIRAEDKQNLARNYGKFATQFSNSRSAASRASMSSQLITLTVS